MSRAAIYTPAEQAEKQRAYKRARYAKKRGENPSAAEAGYQATRAAATRAGAKEAQAQPAAIPCEKPGEALRQAFKCPACHKHGFVLVFNLINERFGARLEGQAFHPAERALIKCFATNDGDCYRWVSALYPVLDFRVKGMAEDLYAQLRSAAMNAGGGRRKKR